MNRSKIIPAKRLVQAIAIFGMIVSLCAAEQSGKAVNTSQPDNSGSASFTDPSGVDKVYGVAVEYLKKQGYTIDSANKDVGQITTAMDIKGGFTQTGTNVQITLIKDSDTQTTVRVTAKTQRRVKGKQEHPWRDIKIDPKESSRIADELKSALKTP